MKFEDGDLVPDDFQEALTHVSENGKAIRRIADLLLGLILDKQMVAAAENDELWENINSECGLEPGVFYALWDVQRQVWVFKERSETNIHRAEAEKCK